MKLSKTDEYYEKYSRAIEAGEVEADPTTIRRDGVGTLELILAATGAATEEEALAMFSSDRPSVDGEREASIQRTTSPGAQK